VVVGVLDIGILAGGLHVYAQSLIAPEKTPESSEQTGEEQSRPPLKNRIARRWSQTLIDDED
jgi:hypothetical protein